MFSEKSANTLQPEPPSGVLIGPPVWPEPKSIEFPAGPISRSRIFGSVRGHEWVTALLFVACDVVSWILLYGFVGFMRRDAFFVSPFEFVLVDLLVVAVIVQALYIIGGYSRKTEMRSLNYTTEHILAVIGAAVVSSMIIYSAAAFDAGMKPSRGVLLSTFILFLPLSLTYRRFLRKRIAASNASQTFLVIGSGELARQFYEVYRDSPSPERLEFVDDNIDRVGLPIAGEGSPRIQGGIAAKLAQLDLRYSGVILAESVVELGRELIERLVRTQFQRARVYTLESFYEAHWRHVPIHSIDPVWPLQMGFQLARVSPYHYLKRLCDIVLSAVLLVIVLPLFPLIMFAIWIESGRPTFFGQVRVGREGHQFVAYKFRTMRHNGDDGDIYTRKDDSRVTRVGHWLRRSRLDELPQLWNVLKGEMSLIGPRAEWIKCVERYESKIPFYHFRHLVKPGITGWAQVNYPYGESDEDAIQKLQYDLYYIRHYSLRLDTMILLKTMHTMAFGKGR